MMTEMRRKQLNKKRLADVKPELSRKIESVIFELETSGLRPLITAGYRSIAEQNRLYALGRTRAGKIVTNAKGGQSKHNYGSAVDFAFLDKDGNINWEDNLFRVLGKTVKKYGLKWGGDFKKFKDRPHVEL